MRASLAEIAEVWWIRLDRSPLRVLRWGTAWLFLGAAMLLLTPLAIVGRLAGFRFLGINCSRIGHLAVEPDCFVKERRFGMHKGIRPLALAPAGRVANRALLDCWRVHLRWITRPWVCAALRPLAWHPLLAFDVSAYSMVAGPQGGCGYIAIARRWHDDPVITLPASLVAAGEAALAQFGLPEGAWFACIQSRDGGYAPQDEDWHAYRNCAIENYLPAMAEIVAAGGWCIRVGDASTTPLAPMRNVVDYAHHPLKSDEIDLFLLARCRFFLGSSSGLFLVSAVFGRPVAVANLTPAEAILPYGGQDLGIPKLVCRRGQPQPLGLAEMLAHPSSRNRYSAQFEHDGLVVVENTAEEIRGLAREMLARLTGRAEYAEADEAMQQAVRAMLRPEHIAYGSTSRVGRDFLRQHRRLLSIGEGEA